MARSRQRSERERQLVLRTISLLRRLAASTSEWQRTQMEEGFTINQALVLHRVVKHGDVTPSELADWMQISRGSVTPTVKRLEDLGLVSRRVDEQDARKQWLAATQEARDIIDEVEEKVLRPVFGTFADWTADDLDRFCEMMARVLESPLLGGKA